jgi:hypothetical protein
MTRQATINPTPSGTRTSRINSIITMTTSKLTGRRASASETDIAARGAK